MAVKDLHCFAIGQLLAFDNCHVGGGQPARAIRERELKVPLTKRGVPVTPIIAAGLAHFSSAIIVVIGLEGLRFCRFDEDFTNGTTVLIACISA